MFLLNQAREVLSTFSTLRSSLQIARLAISIELSIRFEAMLGRWSCLGQDIRYELLESQLRTNGRGQGQLRIDANPQQFLIEAR